MSQKKEVLYSSPFAMISVMMHIEAGCGELFRSYAPFNCRYTIQVSKVKADARTYIFETDSCLLSTSSTPDKDLERMGFEVGQKLCERYVKDR